MMKHIQDKFRDVIFNDPTNNNLDTMRTTAKGTFSPTGLSTDWIITTLDVTDTATLLPATALVGRNALSIYNTSETDFVFIGKSNVTADNVVGTTSGWDLPPKGYMNFDVKDNISIYAIAETGKTIRVKIMELA